MYSSCSPSYRRKLERAARRLNAKQFARLKALGATLHINAYVHNRRPRKRGYCQAALPPPFRSGG